MLVPLTLAACLLCGIVVADQTVADYYGSFKTSTFANTSFSELERHLLEGRPVVVLDGARGLPMADWSCQRVQQEFPTSRIRQAVHLCDFTQGDSRRAVKETRTTPQ